MRKLRASAMAAVMAIMLCAVSGGGWVLAEEGEGADLAEVLTNWDFLPDVPRGEYPEVLRLRGDTVLTDEGPSGRTIRSYPGFPLEDRAQGMVVANHPALTPEGGFAIEMWIKPDEGWVSGDEKFSEFNQATLLSKKYPLRTDHNNYRWQMQRRGESFRFALYMGFGEETDTFHSGYFKLKPGQWHHVAFTYDGRGLARFYVDEKIAGSTLREGRGSITHGHRELHIGDHRGSRYGGFPGHIDSVRIHPRVVEFENDELTGVLKAWNFLPEFPHDEYPVLLRLRGETQLTDEGPSGKAIRTYPGHPIEDKAQGAVISNHPALTPEGGFTIEMQIKPDEGWVTGAEEFSEYSRATLLSKMYPVSGSSPDCNNYRFHLQRAGAQWRFMLHLGFGEERDIFYSDRFNLEPGRWHHAAFTYDGAGEVRFYLDEKHAGGEVKEGRGSISHGRRNLIIGDHLSPNHRGFPGYIDSVRIHHKIVEFEN